MTTVGFEPKDLGPALDDAAANWSNWEPCWRHEGDWREHPILATQVWFGCFAWEYGVYRNFERQNAADIRRALLGSADFGRAVTEGDACALAKAIPPIARKLSAKKSDGGLTSLVTKVAAFVRPQTFMAQDSLALRGLRSINGRGRGGPGASVAHYQRFARRIAEGTRNVGGWNERLRDIDERATEVGAPTYAFRLRVLDNLAMRLGRRLEQASAERRGKPRGKDPRPEELLPDFHRTASWGWAPRLRRVPALGQDS